LSNLSQKLKPYRSLIQSFTSLSILQIANYLFPLIVLPYVVRVLGPAKYGLINFAAAFIAYFNLLCDYGFNFSGTKTIAQIRDDKEKLSNTFSVILSIKFIFLIISFLVLILIIMLIPFFNKYWELYLLSFGFVIGSVLFPNWFFQGIEQMKFITFINVLVKIVTTFLIFYLIKIESDFLLLVLLNASAQILIGLLGLLVALYKFRINFKLPGLKELKIKLKDGWHIFQSMIAINLYTTSNTFILGLFASETVVGYFAAADKIKLAFSGIMSVISQSVFPYVNNLAKDSYVKFIKFIKSLLKLQSALGFCLSVLLFAFAHPLTNILLGENFAEAANILRILAVLPFLISLSNVFGIQIMLPLGYDKAFNRIISSAALSHIILLFVMIPNYFAFGTAISMVITEFIVATFTILFAIKKNVLFKTK